MTLWVAETYEPLPPGLYVGELLDIESRERARMASIGGGAGKYWKDRTLGAKFTRTPPRTSVRKLSHASGLRTYSAGSLRLGSK